MLRLELISTWYIVPQSHPNKFSPPPIYGINFIYQRFSWCNSNHHRKCRRWPTFKSWTRLVKKEDPSLKPVKLCLKVGLAPHPAHLLGVSKYVYQTSDLCVYKRIGMSVLQKWLARYCRKSFQESLILIQYFAMMKLCYIKLSSYLHCSWDRYFSQMSVFRDLKCWFSRLVSPIRTKKKFAYL